MNSKNNLYSKFGKQIFSKTSLFTLCILSFSIAASAQDEETPSRERMTIGLKAGANYANVWDEQGQDFRADAKLGFAGGAFVGIPLGKIFGFQPEFLISQKGFKGSGTLLGTGYSLTRTTTYFDVPLQLQIKPVKYLTLLVGPQYSYLLRQKDVYTLGTNSIDQEQEFERDNVRKNVLGFVIGADVNVNKVVLSARVGWDFQTNNGDGTSSTPRYKNQWLQFTLGYRI